MAHAERETERVELELVVLADRVVDVEADREGPVEEPGLGEADDALLGLRAGADPRRRFPALPEEVALRDVDRPEEAVDGREAAADREQAGRPLDHVDVHDDLRLVGAGRRRDVDGFEKAEVEQPLARPLHLLQREELALHERDLAAQDLVLAAHVADDVDPLDVDLGPFVDLEDDVHRRRVGRLFRAGGHLGGGVADGAVEVADGAERLADFRP